MNQNSNQKYYSIIKLIELSANFLPLIDRNRIKHIKMNYYKIHFLFI